jgi:hypothetical protein
LHGGLTPGGIASPHWKHGQRSRYVKQLTGDIRKHYRAALADPKLLELRSELALLTVRAEQLLERLSVQPPAWDAAAVAVQRLQLALGEEDREAALADLIHIVQEGAGAMAVHESVWAELRELIGERTRTAAAEWRRMTDLDAVLTLGQARLLTEALLGAVRSVVTDPRQLQAVGRAVERVLGWAGKPGEQPPLVTDPMSGRLLDVDLADSDGLGPAPQPAPQPPAPAVYGLKERPPEPEATMAQPLGTAPRESLPPGPAPDGHEWVLDDEDEG